MKNILLAAVILIAFTSIAYAQKIEVDKVDEFEGHRTIATSYEPWVGTSLGDKFIPRLGICFGAMNEQMFFILGISQDKVFSIREGQGVYLKLKNGEQIKLLYGAGEVASRSGASFNYFDSGYYGIRAYLPITREEIDKIKEHGIDKFRVETTEANLDGAAKDKHNQKFVQLANIFLRRYLKHYKPASPVNPTRDSVLQRIEEE